MIENKKVVAVIMARMGSTRFPGKVMADLCGKPVLQHVVERLRNSKYIDKIVLTTTKMDSAENMSILFLAQELGIDYSYEEEDSALGEFMKAAEKNNADIIVRVTADAPLISAEATDRLITHLHQTNADYTHNRHLQGVPLGLHAEVVTIDAMRKVFKQITEKKHLTHITLFILENPELFNISNFPEAKEAQNPNIILTVDRPEELVRIEKIFNDLEDGVSDFKTLTNYLSSRPEFQENEIDYHMDFMNIIHGDM